MNAQNILHKTTSKPLFKIKDRFMLEISAIQKQDNEYIYLIKNSKGLWIKESDIKRFIKAE